MDILKVPFFLFLFLSIIHSKKHCPNSYCGNDNNNMSFPIQYPFKLQSQQPQNCSINIDLTCTTQGIVILNLPYHSGEFNVRYIDYDYSIIQLYDPENCLPRRLMSLNLSSLYPLVAITYKTYTFYTCPSELIALSNFTVIDCLSNSSSATVATCAVSSEVMMKLYRCDEIVTSSIPILWHDQNDFIGNKSDFVLQWIAPPCEDCPHRSEGLVSPSIVEATIIMMSFFTVIMPSLICLGCCVHFVKMFGKEVVVNNSNVR